MQEYSVRIKGIKYLTQDVIEVEVELVSPDTVIFRAGQFMNFQLPGGVRSYSIVSVPDHNNSLKFCVELFEHGAGSDFFRQAKAGDPLVMLGPNGIFTVEDFGRDIFCVAAGVGIAPFASVIPDMLGKGYGGKAHLLFGVRHEENVFYFDRFNHLQHIYQNFKFTPLLSQPRSHWPGETGRVTTYLDVAYEYYSGYLFYICGGTEMVRDTKDLLVRKGHSPRDIRLEIFSESGYNTERSEVANKI